MVRGTRLDDVAYNDSLIFETRKIDFPSSPNLVKSDAWIDRSWLGVKDREFAEGFGCDLAKVLGRRKPYRARWSRRRRRWVAEGWSHLLYGFLQQPLEKLEPFIEHHKECVAAFLRAFFDGEGSLHRHERRLTVYNTDRELLIYIKGLLKRYFDIDSTGPHLGQKSGRVIRSHAKVYRSNKDCYRINIRTHSLPRFHKDIGFTIERKQRRLAEAAKK